MMALAELELEMTCGNCDRPWLDRDERWRSVPGRRGQHQRVLSWVRESRVRLRRGRGRV